MAFRWTCPYCSMTQTVVDKQQTSSVGNLTIEGQAEGSLGVASLAIGCSNPDCLKTTVRAKIGTVHYVERRGWRLDGKKTFFDQSLLPQGTAKPQPEYIPVAIRDDYFEACLIRDLSPKASATLIRRCLQGMIRDFTGIRKGRLVDEIDTLRKAVNEGTADRSITPETVDAIDHVRGVGNIGAHMEKDINMIVDVDPGEAQALIELVELLFEEWYVARETRREKLARIAKIAEDKKEKRSPAKGGASLTQDSEQNADQLEGGLNALLAYGKKQQGNESGDS